MTKSVLIILPNGGEYAFGFFLNKRSVGKHKIVKLYDKPPKTPIYEISLANIERLYEKYDKHEREFNDHNAHIARDAQYKPYICFVSPSETEEGAVEIATNWSILTVHHLLTGEDFNDACDPKEIVDRHSMKISYGGFVEVNWFNEKPS